MKLTRPSTHVTGSVGLDASSECGDGVYVAVYVYGYDVGPPGYALVEGISVLRLSGKQKIDADLSPWFGKTVGIALAVSSGGNSDCDRVVFEDIKIVQR